MRIACLAVAKMTFEQSDKTIQIEIETKPRMVVVSFSSPNICLSALKELLDITQFFESDIRKQQWTVLVSYVLVKCGRHSSLQWKKVSYSFLFVGVCKYFYLKENKFPLLW